MTTSRVIVARQTTGGSSSAIRNPGEAFASGQKGFWIEAADLSQMFKDTAETLPVTTAGDTVASLRDKSGNGYKWQQGSSGLRPTYGVDGGGHAYLSFDGSDDILSTTTAVDLTGSDKCTVIVCFDRQDASAGRIALYNGYGLGHGWAHYADTGGGLGPGIMCSGGSNGYKYLGSGSTALGKYIMSARLDKAQATLDATIDLRVGGKTYRMFATGGSNPGSGNFGSFTNHLGSYPGTFPFLGKFYFAMCVQGIVSDSDLAGYEAYAVSLLGLV